jgi:protocatechuate 3,4-dioxygenase beta subunit
MDRKVVTALSPSLARRDVLAFGALAVFSKAVGACSSSGVAATDDAGDAGGTDAADALDASTGAEASVAEASAEAAADSMIPWATGGTAAMTAKATYPNPFSGVPATCTASCELTEGPCYSSQSVVLQDISYGYDGLPMRLTLRVLDETCAPVAGALVDVWHVGPTGKYSGDDTVNEDVAFCTGNDSDFTSHLYFRGKQTTDASGVVSFDTCFPGWYSTRTIHIHMTISIGTQAYVTTQFGFDDSLDDAIVASQPLYDARGARDTTNATDTVLPSTGLSDYLFETAQMSDGAMLAWKTLILRSSLSETLCSPSGAGGSPGGGGPGGDGGGPFGMGGEGGPPGPPPGFGGG